MRLALPSESEDEIEDSVDEIRRLAWTAGADVDRTFVQHRPKPCPATLIGKGKAEEVKAAADEVDTDMIIVDSDLTPAQGVNLENIFERKVVDRTQLILDIFAQHAHTNEGKLQVELAQLHYMLPRLAGRGSVMRQQGGIGVRGPGEQKLEVDRRRIRRRIGRLREQLDTIRNQRNIQRKHRKENAIGAVSLVGYTNAGKSSLLNALTEASVLVEDKLFATLAPRARQCALKSGRRVVIADTVGFIRHLPHTLIAAFRATLEEVGHADLLVLVADAAHPAVESHISSVYRVLDEIDAGDKPVIVALNKTDIAEPGRVNELARKRPEQCVAVSAKTGEGVESLLDAVDQNLASDRDHMNLRIPQSDAGVISHIHEHGRVLNQQYGDNAVLVEAEVGPALKGRLEQYRV